MTPHVTDFPFGNDPSLKSIFVISSEIPELQDPQLDLTWRSDHDIRMSFFSLRTNDGFNSLWIERKTKDP